jgi:hypothetical protein
MLYIIDPLLFITPSMHAAAYLTYQQAPDCPPPPTTVSAIMYLVRGAMESP